MNLEDSSDSTPTFIPSIPERPSDVVSFANYAIKRGDDSGDDTIFLVIATWFGDNGRVTLVARTTGMVDSKVIAHHLHKGAVIEILSRIKSPMAIITYLNED